MSDGSNPLASTLGRKQPPSSPLPPRNAKRQPFFLEAHIMRLVEGPLAPNLGLTPTRLPEPVQATSYLGPPRGLLLSSGRLRYCIDAAHSSHLLRIFK